MSGLPRPFTPRHWLLGGATAFAAALTLGLTPTTPALAAVTLAHSGTALTHAATPCVSARPAPAGSSFYVPPQPLPSGGPGSIIWSRPSTSPVAGDLACQILYLSTNVSGQRTAISGTLIVPGAPFSGTRPIVAYASGTQGWAPQCAPSMEIESGSFDEEFAVNNLLNQGWAVVITDYPGQGTPGPELYNVGIPEGYGVLDALRAATHVAGAGLSAVAPMAIEGYSQGGGAADWAAQLQPTYAPKLHLVGVAAGGTPANLQAVAANIDGSAFFAFLAGSAIGFNAAYPSLDLNAELTPAGQAAFAQLQTMCQIQGLGAFAFHHVTDYTVGGVNPINTPAWQTVLDENDLGGLTPHVPIYEYHGLIDEVIPYGVEQALHTQYCAQGVTTQLVGYIGDHVLTQLLAQGDVVNWIAARIAGTPAPSNC
ncbi:MAG TPA: lipase family protein [Streptosporangiaceae bacterium]|nr:lipase family protein [Streptosporangiaceae bacterium]